MKKIIKLFIFICVLFLFTINTHAEGGIIENMNCPGGVNVISYDNIVVENNVLSNRYPIYVNKNSFSFSLEIISDAQLDTGNGREVLIDIYDENLELFDVECMNLVSTTSVETSHGAKTYYCGTININYYAYAIKIKRIDVIDDYEDYGEEALIGVFSTNYLNQYVPYTAKTNFVSLKDNHPSISIPYYCLLEAEDLRCFLVAEDICKGIITEDIVIDMSSYDESSLVIGKYQVNLSVSDGTNDFSSFIYVKVIDDRAPSILGGASISFPIGHTISENEIVAEYEAIDEYDGDVSENLYVSSEFNSDPLFVSSQEVEISVCDSSGNKTTKKITVNTIDDEAPTITGNSTIYVGGEVRVTKEEIVSNYFTIQDNVDENPSISFVNDGYTGNENKVGTWNITLRVTDASGNYRDKIITVVVSDTMPPVIYLDLYKIELDGIITLSDDDFAALLYESGELNKNKKYKVRIINDTYHGNESVKGTYVYEALYTSEDGEKVNKAFKIIVSNNEITVSKPNIGFEEMLIIAFASLSITLVIALVVTKTRHKKQNKEV